MIISSLKSLDEYRLNTPTFFPKVIEWSNYATAFKQAELGTLFLNTVYVGLVSTVISIVITVIAAFAFARLEFKGKDTLFAALLATMMIPGELFTITNYATVSDFGWKMTFSALIIPFLVSVFYIYLLRQNFLQIPNELYLAAKVDGTGDFKYLWKVMIPMAKSTITSITILSMMGTWNAYVWPNLVASDKDMLLVSNGLLSVYKDVDGTGQIVSFQMAAAVLVTVPLIIVFLLLRKQIMNGVSRSGIKG
jgi:multiple sugar transport system permease protein